MLIVILSRTRETAEPLAEAVSVLLRPGFRAGPTPATTGPDVRHIVASGFAGDRRVGPPVSIPQAFGELCDALGPLVREHRAVEVWVDEADLTELDPLATSSDTAWETVLAAAMLTFPDVRWRVGFVRGRARLGGNTREACRMRDDFERVAAHLDVVAAGDDPATGLFDADGLRDWIRGLAAASLGVANNYLTARKLHAVALDEETAYSWFNAYTAYRFNFRAVAIASEEQANRRLKKESATPAPYLVYADLYLNFAKGTRGMSDLRKRNDKWEKLKAARWYITVTSDQEAVLDHDRDRKNAAYVEENENRGDVTFARVNKPYAGMWALHEQSGVPTAAALHRGEAAAPVARPSMAELMLATRGHVSQPPARPEALPPAGPASPGAAGSAELDHSSPGMLLLIAEQLLERAEELLPEVRSVEDAVRGAVLASDAFDLLGGRTPTTSVEALRLKHHFEVLAECQFSGVEHHIGLDGRFAELRRHVQDVSKWFGSDRQTDAACNAEMYVLSSLIAMLNDNNQFNEEQRCRNRARRLYHTLWRRQQVWRWPVVRHSERVLRSLMWPLHLYLEVILSSFSMFCGVLVGWIFVLSLLFWYCGQHPSWSSGLADAVSGFFSQGPPLHPEYPDPLAAEFATSGEAAKLPQDPKKGEGFVLVACITMISGFFHLGVFVSHLYSIVSRR